MRQIEMKNNDISFMNLKDAYNDLVHILQFSFDDRTNISMTNESNTETLCGIESVE